MAALTIYLPISYTVTFSVESGHPAGLCRHLSMSGARRSGKAPTPEAIWMVAELLGFQGTLKACTQWMEDIGDGDKAVNIIQPLPT